MAGNPPPRLFETSAGMLNAIGLQNIGARAFIEEKLPILQKIQDTVVIANVFGFCPRITKRRSASSMPAKASPLTS